MRRHAHHSRQRRYQVGTQTSRDADLHREVVADNAPVDWDLPTRSWSTTADGAGRELHRVTEAVQSVRTRKAEKLPELQLCVLQTVPEAGLSPILHVLPSDQEQAEAKGAGRDVERDGGVYWVGGHSIAARDAICGTLAETFCLTCFDKASTRRCKFGCASNRAIENGIPDVGSSSLR